MIQLNFKFSYHLARILKMTDKQCKEAQKKVGLYSRAWNKYGAEILSIFGFKVFHMEFIWPHEKDVYLIANNPSFSDPLCINIRFTPREAVNVIAHELIHILLVDNEDRINFKQLFKDYPLPNKSPLLANHVLVHAVLAKMYTLLHWDKQMQWDIKDCVDVPVYSKAWEIVQKEGYNKIVGRYIK